MSVNSVTYDRPPIVELALSVQFDADAVLNTAHLGAFWYCIREEFPAPIITHPIPSINADALRFQTWRENTLQVGFMIEPTCRIQMASPDEQWMCQIQSDRLVMNWRKRGADYPRFEAVHEYFQRIWLQWIGFAQTFGSPIVPRVWEVVYVNHIAKGELWSTPEQCGEVLPALLGAEALLSDSNSVGFNIQRVVDYGPPGAARVYIEAHPGKSSDQEIIALNFTARGIVEDQQPQTGSVLELINAGMLRGREVITLAFGKVVSGRAAAYWGKRNAAR